MTNKMPVVGNKYRSNCKLGEFLCTGLKLLPFDNYQTMKFYMQRDKGDFPKEYGMEEFSAFEELSGSNLQEPEKMQLKLRIICDKCSKEIKEDDSIRISEDESKMWHSECVEVQVNETSNSVAIEEKEVNKDRAAVAKEEFKKEAQRQDFQSIFV